MATGALLPLLLLLGSACARVEVFDFDFSWTPRSPLPGDSVAFRASAPASVPADRFRWFQQGGSGYQLVHTGRSWRRNASAAGFDGRYKLSVRLGDSADVDVVKFVALQAPIRAALAARGANVTCRFWGRPLLRTLQFLPPRAADCRRRHFATEEAEAFIDLVSECRRLPAGSYACSGRNSVSAAQVTCRVTDAGDVVGCLTPTLERVVATRPRAAAGRRTAAAAAVAAAAVTAAAAAALASAAA